MNILDQICKIKLEEIDLLKKKNKVYKKPKSTTQKVSRRVNKSK